MRSASDLDAVTVDAYGTLLELDDPAPRLRDALAERGADRRLDAVREAFVAEARYYRPRSLAGRDADSLAELRTTCVGVFLDHLGVPIEPRTFVDAFLGSVAFASTPGADAALEILSAAGLSLACVANWDIGLDEHLERLGLRRHFHVVVPSAAVGFEKPDPRIFRVALDRLGIAPHRALHIGNEEVDRQGAAAAGLAFEPVPLATLPERLGL